jgi:hypothetical protein
MTYKIPAREASNLDDDFVYLTGSSDPELHTITAVSAIGNVSAFERSGGSTAPVDSTSMDSNETRTARKRRRALLELYQPGASVYVRNG